MNFTALVEHEQTIRPMIFISLLILFALAEFFYPLAKRKQNHLKQWSTNLALVFVSNLLFKISLPILAVGSAQLSANNNWGLLNYFFSFNQISNNFLMITLLIICIMVMDFMIYWQHVLMHKIPLLWRLHKVHHSEPSLDVTSAVRFHPIEMMLSMFFKVLFIMLFGIPVEAVIIFEILLNAMALFNHSNLKIPKKFEKPLRKLVATPELHWIHHSQIETETNSNYGFNLIVWDKVFGTYTDKPKIDYKEMPQGLSQYNKQPPKNVLQLLIMPFIK